MTFSNYLTSSCEFAPETLEQRIRAEIGAYSAGQLGCRPVEVLEIMTQLPVQSLLETYLMIKLGHIFAAGKYGMKVTSNNIIGGIDH